MWIYLAFGSSLAVDLTTVAMSEDLTEEGKSCKDNFAESLFLWHSTLLSVRAFPVAQSVKNLPAMQEPGSIPE